MTRLVITHRATPPRFSSLPLETRQKIYRYVLNTSLASTDTRTFDAMSPEVLASTRRSISILLTSRQTYTEALPILYQHLSFEWLGWNWDSESSSNFAASIGKPGAALVRGVSINTNHVSKLPAMVEHVADLHANLERLLSLLPGLDTVKLTTMFWLMKDDASRAEANMRIVDCLRSCIRNHQNLTSIVQRWPMSKTHAFFVLYSAKSNFKLYRTDKKIYTA